MLRANGRARRSASAGKILPTANAPLGFAAARAERRAPPLPLNLALRMVPLEGGDSIVGHAGGAYINGLETAQLR